MNNINQFNTISDIKIHTDQLQLLLIEKEIEDYCR